MKARKETEPMLVTLSRDLSNFVKGFKSYENE